MVRDKGILVLSVGSTDCPLFSLLHCSVLPLSPCTQGVHWAQPWFPILMSTSWSPLKALGWEMVEFHLFISQLSSVLPCHSGCCVLESGVEKPQCVWGSHMEGS